MLNAILVWFESSQDREICGENIFWFLFMYNNYQQMCVLLEYLLLK